MPVEAVPGPAAEPPSRTRVISSAKTVLPRPPTDFAVALADVAAPVPALLAALRSRSSNPRSRLVDHQRPPPLRVQPALQDLDCGSLVDHRALTLPPDAPLGQPTRRNDRRHPLVSERYRDRRDHVGQAGSVRLDVLRRRTVFPARLTGRPRPPRSTSCSVTSAAISAMSARHLVRLGVQVAGQRDAAVWPECRPGRRSPPRPGPGRRPPRAGPRARLGHDGHLPGARQGGPSVRPDRAVVVTRRRSPSPPWQQGRRLGGRQPAALGQVGVAAAPAGAAPP